MNIITKRFIFAGSLIASIALSSTVFAADTGSSPASGGNPFGSSPGSSTANLVGGYGTDQLSGKTPTGMFKQTQDSAYNILIGNVIGQIFPPNVTFVPVAGSGNMTLSEQAVFNMLTATNPISSMQQMLLNIPAPISATQAGTINANATAFPLQASQIDTSVNALDFSNFISPVQYSVYNAPPSNTGLNIPGLPTTSSNNPPADSNANALNFITLAAQLFNTPPVLNFTGFSPSQMLAFAGNTAALQYLSAVRSMVAQESIAISNLYFLYSERMPQSTKSLANAMPQIVGISSLYPTASPLSIMQYMATRRYLPGTSAPGSIPGMPGSSTPSWTDNIQKLATPIEVMRQQVYLERDMNYMLYQNYLIQERVLATLSMMELGGVQGQQVMLNQLYQKAVGAAPFGSGSSQGSAAGS